MRMVELSRCTLEPERMLGGREVNMNQAWRIVRGRRYLNCDQATALVSGSRVSWVVVSPHHAISHGHCVL